MIGCRKSFLGLQMIANWEKQQQQQQQKWKKGQEFKNCLSELFELKIGHNLIRSTADEQTSYLWSWRLLNI